MRFNFDANTVDEATDYLKARYFKNWLKKLEISEDEYQYFKKHLI